MEQRDDNPPERHWYLFPFFKIAAIVGITATTLGGIKCYQDFRTTQKEQKTLEQKVEFKTIYKDQTMFRYSPNAPRKPHGRVVTNEAELEQLYSETSFSFLHSKGKFVPISPDYRPDFSKEMVIAVFQGQRPTTGYDITLTDIVEKDDVLIVTSNLVEPSGGLAGAAITHPGHYVVCKKTNKPVQFAWKKVNPFENVYSIFPRDFKQFYTAPGAKSPTERLDILDAKSKQWREQFKKDCQRLNISLSPKFDEEGYQRFPTWDMKLEPQQAEALKKIGYDVIK